MTRRRLVTSAITALALAVSASPAMAAPAAFFPADPIDGPNAGIVKVGGLDVARDGSGAVSYVKLDGGVPHIFVSRLVRGAWQPPERIDGTISAAGSDPVVAASDGGRLVVAFIADGQLFYAVRPAGATAWPAPVAAGGPAATPSVDMSVNGAAYLVWSAAGDVRAARLDRKATAFVALPAPLDINLAAVAGDAGGRPRVAIAADGIATAVWGESGHVYARRMFDLRLSTAPQQVDVPALKGLNGGVADTPDLDSEDDSSFAWVVFTEAFSDGTTHVLGRRLRGSLFDDAVDLGNASAPRIDLNGRGEGLVGMQGSPVAGPFVASLQDDQFAATAPLGGAFGVAPNPQPAMAEGGDGVIAWMQGSSAADATVRGLAFTKGKPGTDSEISNPAFGPVDPLAGIAAASNRAGDVVVVFVQGQGDQRRIVSGTYDRAPGTFTVTTSQKWRKVQKISWGASFELWSPPTYTVFADGVQIGQTNTTNFVPSQPLAEGSHRVQIVATDRRGQKTVTKTRLLRFDTTGPKLKVRIKGARSAGQAITFSRTVSDGGSGVATVSYAFDGGRPVVAKSVKHAFGGGGHTIVVKATDRAGNVTTVTKHLRIG